MRTGPNQASSKLRLFWRRLVGAVAIYALAMQPLLLTVAGSQLAQAAAIDDVSFLQLCLHNADGGPFPPEDQENPPAPHWLHFFAGAFHLLEAAQPVTVGAADREFRK